MPILCIMTTLVNSVYIPVVLGIFTTLVGWIITTILMVPKIKIDDVERDCYGNPFIKIWNKSALLNAYKVVIFIGYKKATRDDDDNDSQIFHTKIRESILIPNKGYYWLSLNIDKQKKIEERIELSICVIAHNKFGITTAVNEKRILRKIVAPIT